MTLVAGFNCRDGYVLAADTEITFGDIRFQSRKLDDFFSSKYGYHLTIGGAGEVSYMKMAAQQIASAVDKLNDPDVEAVQAEAEKVVLRIHETNLKFWEQDDPYRPSFSLVIGVHDSKGGIGVFKVDKTAVLRIDACGFIGSGATLAEHIAEKLCAPQLPSVAIVTFLASQIFREVKTKGAYVGGNTEIDGVKSRSRKAEPFFQVSNKDYRFLWGLEEATLSALRVALDIEKPSKVLDQRIRQIAKLLRGLRRDCEKPRGPSGGDSIHIVEFGSEYGSMFKDI
jgi:20S proteasome alpha/beta subunit